MSSALNVSEIAGVEARRAVAAVLRSGASVSVLIAGAEGGGQREIAERLAKGHLCVGEAEKPCGQCRTCGAYERGNSTDLLRIEPGGKSDLIRIHQITRREGEQETIPAQDFLRVGPILSPVKVVLIQEAERMNSDAANALLKVLEEPPDYARFVLSTANLSRLMPTIISRCLLIGCDLQPDESLPPPIAALSGGAPDLIALLNSTKFEGFADDFYSWVNGLSNAKPSEAMRLSSEFQNFAVKYQELARTDQGGENGVRVFRTEFLYLFANALGYQLSRGQTHLVKLAARVVEAHAAVQGNVRFDFVCDSMFAEAFQPG
jgi:hypothetical protein